MNILNEITGASLIERPDPIKFDKEKQEFLCILRNNHYYESLKKPETDKYSLYKLHHGRSSHNSPYKYIFKGLMPFDNFYPFRKTIHSWRSYVEDLLRDVYAREESQDTLIQFDSEDEINKAIAKILIANIKAREELEAKLSNS